MFGVFGKSKYLKEVYPRIDFLIEKAGVPKTTPTFEEIRKEVKLNAPDEWNENLDWHSVIAEQIYEVAWAQRNHMFKIKKYSPQQAAVFCISHYISYLAEKGTIKETKKSQPDMYESLKLLWQCIGELMHEMHEGEYDDAIIAPRDGNPFDKN